MSVWFDGNRKHWKVKFWYKNTPYYQGAFNTKRDAARWEREKRNELETPPEPTILTTSLQKLATMYLDHCYATFQPNTCRAKKAYYKRFFAFLVHPRQKTEYSEDDPPDSIPQFIYMKFFDYVARRDGKKNSNRHLKDFKALFNWAVEKELIDRNPIQSIQPKGEDQYIKYVPQIVDINAVLLAADPDQLDLLTCIYKPAARLSEIMILKWDDINFNVGSVRLWSRKRKGGGWKFRSLKMPRQMRDRLKARYKCRNKQSPFFFCQSNEEPFSKDSKWIRNMLEDLCEKAEVKRFTFHALRHRMSANLMDSGEATLGMIQEYLGHQRKTTTEDYLKTIDRGAIDATNIIDSIDDETVANEESKD